MSDLQPKGTALTLLDGEERRILFTLSVVDEIQSHYGLTVPEVFAKTGDPKEQSDALSFIVLSLINNSIKRNNRLHGTDEEYLTMEYVKDNIDMLIIPEINRAIAKSYGYSVPEPDEDDEPDLTKEASS